MVMGKAGSRTPAQQKQAKIVAALRGLDCLPKTSVVVADDGDIIEIQHEQVFVPNFRFDWCYTKEHFRVYIFVAGSSYDKTKAGYPICTINSPFAAMGFGTIYGFLHKHRANNKEEAYATR